MDGDVSGCRARWVFHPRTESGRSREVPDRDAHRLERLVGSGHAVGAAVELRLATGRAAQLSLAAVGPPSRRWVERALFSAYAPGQWRRTDRTPRSPAHLVAVGRAAGAGRLPTWDPGADWGSITRSLVWGLSTLPAGGELEIQLTAVRPPWLGPILESLVARAPPPAHSREAPRRDRSASVSPVHEPARPRPTWAGTLRLRSDRPLDGPDLTRAAGAVRVAFRGAGGGGVALTGGGTPLWGRGAFPLTDQDVAALLPHPHAEELAAPPRPTGRGLPLGRTARGELVEVPVEPDQGRHLVIFGETGMGKSSLLVSLAARAARQGGLVVLDPMGDTAEEIQRELAPDARRVLAIGPEGPAPALNALDGLHPDGTDPVDRERRIADLVHALRRVRSGRFTDAAFWGPRLEEFLTRAVRAAAAFPGGTLEDAHALLASDEARRRLGPPNARALLGELYARLRARPEDAEGARRLLDEVVRDPTLRRLLCARTPDLSTSELVKPGAVTVVSGAARRVGEATARYLLAVYLALIWSELIATSRTAKTFVFLDEAQWFAHESLAEMLRLARRRNVHVVLATQSAAALPESVRESVWTNAADVASFRGSPEEARDLERAVPGARADRLLSLDRGEAAVLIGKGASVHWIRTARSPRPVPGTVASAVPRASPLGSAVNGRSVEEICRWLGERATAARAVGPFPVRWAEIDPDFERPGARLREVGSCLGRWGAIVRTERGPAGPIWWLAPEVIVARTAPDPAPAAARSSPAQPS